MLERADVKMKEQYTEGYLVASRNPGKYTVGSMQEGEELLVSKRVDVYAGGSWIRGSIGYGSCIYSVGEERDAFNGAYVLLKGGGTIGLCVGMKVRVLLR